MAQWFAAHEQEPEFAVLTADTTVADGAAILGKPESGADAVDMLERLSGRTHQVLTAVCVYWQGVRHDVVQVSEVRFKTLTAEEIAAYVASGEPMDKAGAYGIQGLGGVFVEHLQGSFTDNGKNNIFCGNAWRHFATHFNFHIFLQASCLRQYCN